MNEIYKNNFGVVHEGYVTLAIQNKKQKIALKNIIKIEFLKRQRLHINYAAFLLATYLLFFLTKKEMSVTYQAITLLLVSILLITSFYSKQYQYKLLVTKKNDFLILTVTEKLSQDAADLVKQTKKQIALEIFDVKVNKKLNQDADVLAKQTKKQIALEIMAMRVSKKVSQTADDLAKLNTKRIATEMY